MKVALTTNFSCVLTWPCTAGECQLQPTLVKNHFWRKDIRVSLFLFGLILVSARKGREARNLVDLQMFLNRSLFFYGGTAPNPQ